MEMSSELSLPSLDGLNPIEARSVILPYVLRFATASPPSEYPVDVVVLVDPTNRSITFIEGPFNPETVFHDEGPLPASKASIKAIPAVRVLDEGTDCTICLSDFEIGGEAKEMPCRHRFHSICIDKWLGINGSCPICRYKMPVDEEWENEDEENGEDDDGGMEMEEERMMFVFHIIVRRDTDHRDSDSNIALELEVQRDSDEVLIAAGDDHDLEAQDMVTDSN